MGGGKKSSKINPERQGEERGIPNKCDQNKFEVLRRENLKVLRVRSSVPKIASNLYSNGKGSISEKKEDEMRTC